MDAVKVQILLECLEQGSMMRAAEKLGYTPSGLTHMMDALERELGVQVIERGRHGIRLTADGEQLLPLLRGFTAAEQALLQASRRIQQANRGVIRLGSYSSMARNWLPQIVSSFQEKYPEYRIDITVLTRATSYEALRSGQVDMLFGCDSAEYDYQFLPMKKDYYVAVLPRDSYKSDNGYFHIRHVEDRHFLMPTFGMEHDVGKALQLANVEPRRMSLFADNAVIISMVSGGMGMTILPEIVLRGYVVNADVLPLEPELSRVIGLVYRSAEELTPAEKHFIEHVKDCNIK